MRGAVVWLVAGVGDGLGKSWEVLLDGGCARFVGLILFLWSEYYIGYLCEMRCPYLT